MGNLSLRTILLFFFLIGTFVGIVLVLINSKPTEGDMYKQSIQLGGEWYLANQDETFLHYEYDYGIQEHPERSHALREIASIWALGELSTFLDDDRYEKLARKGFEHFEPFLAYDEEFDYMYMDFNDGESKLGYNAFMILGLLEIDYPQKDYYLDKLANGILYQQNDDGSFETYFYAGKTSGIDYYPGESMFALMALYSYKPNDGYLRAVEDALPYYRDYWRVNKNTAFIAWQARGYALYVAEKQNEDMRDFVFEMNDYLIDQYRGGECDPYCFTKGISTATHVESMVHAYDVAVLFDDVERQELYLDFLKQAAEYTVSLQVTIDMVDDIYAIGGYRRHESSTSVRVDRNQHAVVGLIEGYEYLLGEGK